MQTEKKTCCVFGHRKIAGKTQLKVDLTKIIENLIVNENVDTFLVGSKSEFDELCREVLCELKEKYPNIKRIYVRAEYSDINDNYEKYLLQSCEHTYFPDRARKAGKAVYVQRNYEMIDNSDICVVYFKDNYLPQRRKNSRQDLFDYQPKSGTSIAYKYAAWKNRIIINLAESKKTLLD